MVIKVSLLKLFDDRYLFFTSTYVKSSGFLLFFALQHQLLCQDTEKWISKWHRQKESGRWKQSFQLAAALRPAPNWDQMLLTLSILCCHSIMYLLLLSQVLIKSVKTITNKLLDGLCYSGKKECSFSCLLVPSHLMTNVSARFLHKSVPSKISCWQKGRLTEVQILLQKHNPPLTALVEVILVRF